MQSTSNLYVGGCTSDERIMTEFPFLLEAVKAIGFPALIFAIWYFYHKSEVKAREQFHKAESERFQQILAQMEARHTQTFELMKDAIKSVQHHTMILARIENKIDNSQFCPYSPQKRSNNEQ